MSLTVDVDGRKVDLENICFKPLSPQHEECSIMSVLNYFQNDEELLRRASNTSNYLDHINTCVT